MRALGRAALLALVPLAALAQTPPQPARQTLLHLSASASVQMAPDRLVAELLAQSSAATPAAAQRRVNALMHQGMAAAKAAPAIEAQALGYQVEATGDDKRPQWTARQTLTLNGADADAVLDLTNTLQQQGFATTALDWTVSPPVRRKARMEAMAAALKELRAQADAAAGALGMRVDHIQDVQVEPQEPGPFRAAPMVRAMAAAPPPMATPAGQDETVTASAEIVLE